MAAFRGSFTAKVEDGGRLKLPGPYKKLLDDARVTEFYITSEDGVIGQIWPLPEWEKVEARLRARSSNTNKAVKKYKEITSRYGQQVEMDKQARVTLPQRLRESAGLEGEVLVSGNVDHMWVQNIEMAEKSFAEMKLTDEDFAVLDPILNPGTNG